MNNNLFPTFEVPDLTAYVEKEEEKYRRSVLWNFATGDFVRDGANRLTESSGRDTYKQWCVKVISTERYMYLAYPDEIGTEMEDAVKQPDQAAVISAIERTITEALLINPRTEYVRDFSFSINGDNVYCEFTVKGKDWEEIKLNTTIGMKGVGKIWQ